MRATTPRRRTAEPPRDVAGPARPRALGLARRRALGRALALGAVGIGGGVLSGCFGDPAPDPATAGLEVVLDGCALNRPDVAPGTHRFDLIGPGDLVVTDGGGAVALDIASGGAGELVSTSQTYTFTCTVGTEQTSATLQSVPES
ncbi:MAG: hypothetical protein ACR2FV_07815 [Ornithinimicrobium sp.]|uniref:hypothetical protein n=1 Tax=Ornithinimicrobium sp. TaxID=1977084 RepID=UPI003D9ACF77